MWLAATLLGKLKTLIFFEAKGVLKSIYDRDIIGAILWR
jgi:hypothetical protein